MVWNRTGPSLRTMSSGYEIFDGMTPYERLLAKKARQRVTEVLRTYTEFMNPERTKSALRADADREVA
jgi:hypothetical protein